MSIMLIFMFLPYGCSNNTLSITDIYPNYAKQTHGQPVTVTLEGTGFLEDGYQLDWVRIGNYIINQLDNLSDQSVDVTLPAGTDPAGTVDVAVHRSPDNSTALVQGGFYFFEDRLAGLFSLDGYRMPASCADNPGVATMDLNGDGYEEIVFAASYMGVRVYVSDPLITSGMANYKYVTFTKVEKAGAPGEWQYVGGESGVRTTDVALFRVSGCAQDDGTYLFVANSGQNTLFRISSNGDEVILEDRCYLLPSAVSRPAMRCVAGDVDGNGWVDRIIVVNGRLDDVSHPTRCEPIGSGEPSDLYLNQVYTISTDGGALTIGLNGLPGDDGRVCSTMADLGDVDDDGDQDLIIANFGREGGRGWPNDLYLFDGSTSDFARVTDPGFFPDLALSQATVGVSFADVNTDNSLGEGYEDLLVLNFQDDNRLYLNAKGQGQGWLGFKDASDKLPSYSGLSFNMKSHHDLAFLELNGDNNIDVFIGGENNHYYINQGFVWDPLVEQQAWAGYRLPDEDEWAVPKVFSTISVGLVDFDKDGNKDVIAGGFVEQNRLYINHGDGRLEDMTIQPGVFPSDGEMTFKAAFGTFDLPGGGDWPKQDFIVLANGAWTADSQNAENLVYLNDGLGGFRDGTKDVFEVSERYSERTRDVVSFFSDTLTQQDGPILFFANDTDPNRMYIWDRQTGRFKERSLPSALRAEGEKTLGVTAADFDQDGYTDLAILRILEGNKVFFNAGAPAYFDDAVPVILPGGLGAMSRAVAAGCLDQDHYPDLVVANTGPNTTYGNQVYFYTHPRSFTGPYRLPNSQNLYSNGVTLACVNDDIYPDILIANGVVGVVASVAEGQQGSVKSSGQKDSLYINNGDRTFTDQSHLLPEESDTDLLSSSADVDAADLDSDGLVDIIVYANYPQADLFGWKPITRAYHVYRSGVGETLRLLDLTEFMFSSGDTGFDNDAQAMPAEDYAWGALFGDVNGDQVPDLLVATDGQNRLFKTRYTGCPVCGVPNLLNRPDSAAEAPTGPPLE